MSPQQPALKQRGHSVHQRQQVIPQVRMLADDLVLITQFGQSIVPRPSIRAHTAAWFDHFPDRRLEALAGSISYSAHADSANALLGFLYRHDDQCFSCGPTTTFSRALPSDKNLINFDHAVEPIPAGSDHSSPELVQPIPGRVITAQSQASLQSQRTHSGLLVSYIPHGFEPNP